MHNTDTWALDFKEKVRWMFLIVFQGTGYFM